MPCWHSAWFKRGPKSGCHPRLHARPCFGQMISPPFPREGRRFRWSWGCSPLVLLLSLGTSTVDVSAFCLARHHQPFSNGQSVRIIRTRRCFRIGLEKGRRGYWAARHPCRLALFESIEWRGWGSILADVQAQVGVSRACWQVARGRYRNEIFHSFAKQTGIFEYELPPLCKLFTGVFARVSRRGPVDCGPERSSRNSDDHWRWNK